MSNQVINMKLRQLVVLIDSLELEPYEEKIEYTIKWLRDFVKTMREELSLPDEQGMILLRDSNERS